MGGGVHGGLAPGTSSTASTAFDALEFGSVAVPAQNHCEVCRHFEPWQAAKHTGVVAASVPSVILLQGSVQQTDWRKEATTLTCAALPANAQSICTPHRIQAIRYRSTLQKALHL